MEYGSQIEGKSKKDLTLGAKRVYGILAGAQVQVYRVYQRENKKREKRVESDENREHHGKTNAKGQGKY